MFGIDDLLIGAGVRALPHVLDGIVHIFTAKSDNEAARDRQEHELASLREQNASALALAEKNLEIRRGEENMEWLKAAGAAVQLTGVKFIDGLNQAVRPVVTFWLFGIFALIRSAQLSFAVWTAWLETHAAGAGWSSAFHTLSQALDAIWTGDDQALLANILGFWFLDRAIMRSR